MQSPPRQRQLSSLSTASTDSNGSGSRRSKLGDVSVDIQGVNLNRERKLHESIRVEKRQQQCGLFTIIGILLLCTVMTIVLIYLMFWFFLPLQSNLNIILQNAADMSTRANKQSYEWFSALDNAAKVVNAVNGTNMDQLVDNVKSAAEHAAAANVAEVVKHITDVSEQLEQLAHRLQDKKQLDLQIGGFTVGVPFDDPKSISVKPSDGE
jgi:methyl-accepting chemotaxis protein